LPETVAFAYLAQQRCDPKHLALHFSTLVRYYDAAMSAGENVPDWFMQLIVEERDRGRFTEDEYLAACSAFGFGPGGSLGVDIGDADAAFLQLALKHGMEQAAGTGKSVREVADQFRILLYARGEKALVDDFERQAAQGWMTLDEAYRLLQAGRDVDEELLIVSATMFISDAPSQADKVREAVGLIADARGSLRLKKYLEIGVDRKPLSLFLRRLYLNYLQLAKLPPPYEPPCLEGLISWETPATLTRYCNTSTPSRIFVRL
jgi:ubiquitin carboxyl-terminal hydrolase 25/28